MRRAVALSAAILAAACASAPQKKAPAEVTPMVGAGAILHAWTQIVPGGPEARAIVEGPDRPCPEIVLDELPPVKMTSRPRDGDPVTVCEHRLLLPDGRPAARAQVADRLLPVPGTAPARIAVIGDTFAEFAQTIARRKMPTLVVYAGKEWQQSFFEPAGDLLQVAPWQMADGDAFASQAARLYERLLEMSGGGPGYLMLVAKGSDSWDAVFTTSKGEETRPCRFGGNGFDCGLP